MSSHLEQELSKARLEAINADSEAFSQKHLVEVIEKQRDRVESLLRAVMASADPASLAYRNAQKYLAEIEGLDKWERRLDG